MNAVILAGGRGERLRPLTDEIPKPLLPLRGKMMIEHLFDILHRGGITNVTLTLGYMAETFREKLGDGSKFGFKTVCYGHAGDGNLHVNIIKGDLSDTDWDETVGQGVREIFELVKRLGGTLSGEHGIGFVQKDYMDIVFSKTELELMRDIKKVFDPNNILNPGKILA